MPNVLQIKLGNKIYDIHDSRVEEVIGALHQDHIVWHPGAYDMATGTFPSNPPSPVRYFCTDKMPGVVRDWNILKGWNEGSGYSFISLWNDGTYVGAIYSNKFHDPNGTVVTDLDYDELALNLYVEDITSNGSVDYIYVDLPERREYDDSHKFDNLEYCHEWRTGGYDINTGEYSTIGTTYQCSTEKIPKDLMPLVVGFYTGENGASYYSLYLDNVYVGSYYDGKWHDTSGTVWNYIIFDHFTMNKWLGDEKSTDARLISNGHFDMHKFDNLTYCHEWRTGYYDMNTGEYSNIGTTYQCSTDKIPKDLMPLVVDFYTGENSASYYSLYLDNVYVGSYYDNKWHDTTNTACDRINFDRFTMNKWLSDEKSTDARLISNGYFESADKHIEIKVSTTAQLIEAVDRAKNGMAPNVYYDIKISSGTYDLWGELDKSEIYGTGDQLYHRGLELPDRCNLYGIGTVVLRCAIPESDNSSEHGYTGIVSTLNMHNTENILENIHFVGDNTRYCIHDDSGFDESFKTLIVNNCKFTHTGTKSDLYMPDPRCYGAGYTTGRKAYFNNCIFASEGNCDKQLYVHTHQAENNVSDIELYVNDCAFITPNKTPIHYQIPWYTEYGGVLTLNDNYFASGSKVLLDNLADIDSPVGGVVFGGGNSDFTFDNRNNSTIYVAMYSSASGVSF